ncbi:MAG: recombinase family protein [Dehalococcoidales bacterium]|nr:recombinase family protein [Dehalococcoidales bacterium]
MKVCLYARVSTSDKEQDPMTQLIPLREFVQDQKWTLCHEYVDQVPATDLVHRTAWRELLSEASKRRFDLLLVWRMDRLLPEISGASTRVFSDCKVVPYACTTALETGRTTCVLGVQADSKDAITASINK